MSADLSLKRQLIEATCASWVLVRRHPEYLLPWRTLWPTGTDRDRLRRHVEQACQEVRR